MVGPCCMAVNRPGTVDKPSEISENVPTAGIDIACVAREPGSTAEPGSTTRFGDCLRIGFDS